MQDIEPLWLRIATTSTVNHDHFFRADKSFCWTSDLASSQGTFFVSVLLVEKLWQHEQASTFEAIDWTYSTMAKLHGDV